MAHDHTISDRDTYFVIDPATRAMSTESKKLNIMQGDHDSERYTFKLPRYIEDHDMSACDRVEVHYLNLSKDRQIESRGVYICDLVDVANDTVLYDWVISRNATKHVGTMNFLVKFICNDEEGNIAYLWQTDIFTKVNVYESIDNTETAIEDMSDILEKWKQEVIEGIDIPEPDLTGYATESYVDEAIASIDIPEVDFTGYATETYVDEKVAGIDIPEVPTNVSAFSNDAGYITEVPEVDFTGYATETYVDEKVASIDIPEVNLEGYATETYVNEAVANIDIPDVDFAGYATVNDLESNTTIMKTVDVLFELDKPTTMMAMPGMSYVAFPVVNVEVGKTYLLTFGDFKFSGEVIDSETPYMGNPDYRNSGDPWYVEFDDTEPALMVKWDGVEGFEEWWSTSGLDRSISLTEILSSKVTDALIELESQAATKTYVDEYMTVTTNGEVIFEAPAEYVTAGLTRLFAEKITDAVLEPGKEYIFRLGEYEYRDVAKYNDGGIDPFVHIGEPNFQTVPYCVNYYPEESRMAYHLLARQPELAGTIGTVSTPDWVTIKNIQNVYDDMAAISGSGGSSLPSTEEAMFEAVIYAGLVRPVSNASGVIYTNSSGAVYTF